MNRLVVLGLLLLTPGLAFGQELTFGAPTAGESERNWVLELNGGRMRPQIDGEAGLTGSPYNDMFGKKSLWLFEAELDYKLFELLGPLSLGVAAGYGVVWGHALLTSDTGSPAPDTTTLSTVPLRALAVYRFEWLDRSLGIPLVPFLKAGLAHTIWWAKNGSDSVAKFGENRALGGKWGYEVAAGLGLSLNWLDREAGRDFDLEWGVNSVMLQLQWARLTADNFGGAGLDLSDDTWLFGLAFEF